MPGAPDRGVWVPRKNAVGMLGAAALVLALVAVPAGADAQTRMDGVDGRSSSRQDQARPAFAMFEGRTIDLSGDWDDAQACLIWREGGVLECFRTRQALEARGAELAPGPPASELTESGAAVASYSYSCGPPLKLFDWTGYGGRELWFYDRGYWQNLGDYGFGDRTSSYVVGGCDVYLADYRDGGGWWYPGPTYAYAGEPAMQWGWQNHLSSIYIA